MSIARVENACRLRFLVLAFIWFLVVQVKGVDVVEIGPNGGMGHVIGRNVSTLLHTRF